MLYRDDWIGCSLRAQKLKHRWYLRQQVDQQGQGRQRALPGRCSRGRGLLCSSTLTLGTVHQVTKSDRGSLPETCLRTRFPPTFQPAVMGITAESSWAKLGCSFCSVRTKSKGSVEQKMDVPFRRGGRDYAESLFQVHHKQSQARTFHLPVSFSSP